MRYRNYILIIVVIALIIVGMRHADEAAAGPITVGVIAPLSGSGAEMGENIQRTFTIVDDANERITFNFQDNEGCNTKKAISAYQLMKAQGTRVFFVACSGSTVALAPIIKEDGNILVTSYAGTPDLRKTGDEAIRFNPDALSFFDEMEKYFDRHPEKTFAILYEKQDYPQSMFDLVKKSLGDRLVHVNSYLPDQISYRTELLKFKRDDIDEIIFVPVSTPSAEVIYKEMSDINVNKPLVGDVNVCDLPVQPDTHGLTGRCWKAELDTPGFHAYAALFEERYGVAPQFPFFDAVTYDLALFLSDFLKDTDQVSDKVISDMKKDILNGVEGIVTDYTFDATGQVLGGDYFLEHEF